MNKSVSVGICKQGTFSESNHSALWLENKTLWKFSIKLVLKQIKLELKQIKFLLSPMKHLAIKTEEEVDVYIHAFLTSIPDVTTGQPQLEGRIPPPPCALDKRMVIPRAVDKISFRVEYESVVIQPMATHYTD
jgi:hypothetical protein